MLTAENIVVILSAGWLWISTLFHIAAFLIVVLHCLYSRKESASAVLWIFVAWSLPGIGPLLYLMFGVNRVPAKGWHKRHSNKELRNARLAREADEAMPLVYWRALHDALATEPNTPFAREMNGTMNTMLPDFPLLDGNRVEPLIAGDEAYPAMIEAIRAARHHIHMQTFILGNDRVGRMFLDALQERARAGVKVRLLYDRVGSSRAWMGRMFSRYARTPNMRIAGWTQIHPLKRHMQINLRNHRKLLVVDGHTAFMGGLNIRDENITAAKTEAIRDYHFRVHGPIVQELQYAFMTDWYFATDEDAETLLTREHFPHIASEGHALVRVVNGGPETETEVIGETFFAAIVAARKTLLTVTPYFVPTPDIVRAFRSAALRGVDVRLVVPARNNHVYAGLAGRSFYDTLLSAGVRLFERPPPFMHAKAMLVDDELALVGTANLDTRSLRLNYETNLAVYDAVFIDKLKRIMLEDISLSTELELSTWRRRPLRKQMAENFCRLLSPIL